MAKKRLKHIFLSQKSMWGWREKREGAVKRGEERRGLTWVVEINRVILNIYKKLFFSSGLCGNSDEMSSDFSVCHFVQY